MKFKTEQEHQEFLAKRRAYYAKNKAHIQIRDQKSLAQRKAADPEKYKPRPRKRPYKPSYTEMVDPATNPELAEIAQAIAEEDRG